MKPLVVLLGIASFASVAPAAEVTSFFDDFESGLSQWVGRSGGGHGGITVADPLNSGRGQVLSFLNYGIGGDIFSASKILCDEDVLVSFDYLGLAQPGSVPDDFGGFLGVSKNLNPKTEGVDLFWEAGTVASYPGLKAHLVDDGAWHHYEFVLDGSALGAFRLTLEDFAGSGGNCGDIYFDNLLVQCADTPIPEPSTAALTALAAGVVGLIRRRKA